MTGQSIDLFSNIETSPDALTGDFENKLFQFVSHNEKPRQHAYGHSNVNIGYGYNINAQIDLKNGINYFISDFTYVASLKLPGTTINTNYLKYATMLVTTEKASLAAKALFTYFILTPGITGSEWQLSILALERILSLTGLIQTTSSTQGQTSYDTNAFIVPPVIPPFLTGLLGRIHAARFSF